MTIHHTGDSPAVRGWLPEEEAFAEKLWLSGVSGTKVAAALLAEFGIRKSNNAVIGRARDRGWVRDESVKIGRQNQPKRVREPKPKPQAVVKAPPAPPPPPKPLEPLNLLTMPDYGRCKWELPSGLFCGLPTQQTRRGYRSSYCPQCSGIVYVPGKKVAL